MNTPILLKSLDPNASKLTTFLAINNAEQQSLPASSRTLEALVDSLRQSKLDRAKDIDKIQSFIKYHPSPKNIIEQILYEIDYMLHMDIGPESSIENKNFAPRQHYYNSSSNIYTTESSSNRYDAVDTDSNHTKYRYPQAYSDTINNFYFDKNFLIGRIIANYDQYILYGRKQSLPLHRQLNSSEYKSKQYDRAYIDNIISEFMKYPGLFTITPINNKQYIKASKRHVDIDTSRNIRLTSNYITDYIARSQNLHASINHNISQLFNSIFNTHFVQHITKTLYRSVYNENDNTGLLHYLINNTIPVTTYVSKSYYTQVKENINKTSAKEIMDKRLNELYTLQTKVNMYLQNNINTIKSYNEVNTLIPGVAFSMKYNKATIMFNPVQMPSDLLKCSSDEISTLSSYFCNPILCLAAAEAELGEAITNQLNRESNPGSKAQEYRNANNKYVQQQLNINNTASTPNEYELSLNSSYPIVTETELIINEKLNDTNLNTMDEIISDEGDININCVLERASAFLSTNKKTTRLFVKNEETIKFDDNTQYVSEIYMNKGASAINQYNVPSTGDCKLLDDYYCDLTGVRHIESKHGKVMSPYNTLMFVLNVSSNPYLETLSKNLGFESKNKLIEYLTHPLYIDHTNLMRFIYSKIYLYNTACSVSLDHSNIEAFYEPNDKTKKYIYDSIMKDIIEYNKFSHILRTLCNELCIVIETESKYSIFNKENWAEYVCNSAASYVCMKNESYFEHINKKYKTNSPIGATLNTTFIKETYNSVSYTQENSFVGKSKHVIPLLTTHIIGKITAKSSQLIKDTLVKIHDRKAQLYGTSNSSTTSGNFILHILNDPHEHKNIAKIVKSMYDIKVIL